MVSVAEQQPIRADDNAHVRHIFLLGFAPINIKEFELGTVLQHTFMDAIIILFCNAELFIN